jgi:hypothetical protein
MGITRSFEHLILGATTKNIIIVGNGSSLLGVGLGNQIDKFDIVVRLNNFRINSYEPDVGRKMTYWAVRQSRSMLQSLKEHWPINDIRTIKTIMAVPTTNIYTDKIRLLIPKLDLNILSINEFTSNAPTAILRTVNGISECSTGFYSIIASLQIWGKVTIVGFGGNKNYWGEENTRDYSDEKLIINRLVEFGILSYLDA